MPWKIGISSINIIEVLGFPEFPWFWFCWVGEDVCTGVPKDEEGFFPAGGGRVAGLPEGVVRLLALPVESAGGVNGMKGWLVPRLAP